MGKEIGSNLRLPENQKLHVERLSCIESSKNMVNDPYFRFRDCVRADLFAGYAGLDPAIR